MYLTADAWQSELRMAEGVQVEASHIEFICCNHAVNCTDRIALSDFYNVKSLCPLEVESYELLHLMVSLLRLSPSKVITHMTKLKRLWDARGLRQL